MAAAKPGKSMKLTPSPPERAFEEAVGRSLRGTERRKVEILDLPNAGIRGNSHMLMMDRNNLQVAGLIQEWLAKQRLYR